ncbi:MAG: lipid IV(A) palmitoyltransferase PagP [Legionella sp.]|jgi:palmitoyl transferase
MTFFYSLTVFANQNHKSCSRWVSFVKPVCQRLHHIWVDGDTDLYLSGYAWHNRYTYTPEKVQSYNELAWGGGLGKSLFGTHHDWQGIYAIGFLDSHRHVEPAVGYAYLKVASFTPNLKAGLGFTVLVTSRVDIYNGIPFPGVLPWAGIFYKKAAIAATYIPGAVGAGNVLYIIGKYSF